MSNNPIATQGMIRCTKCGAIFHGKGDDIAPLGGRTIYAWDDLACKICDQWGHTGADLEWFPDAELPEDMDSLKWSFDKALEHLSMLEEAGKMATFNLWGAIRKVGEDWEKEVREKYGDKRRIEWVRENCDTGYSYISNEFRMLSFLAGEGEKYKKVRDKAWWAKSLEKEHPVRIKCEAELAEWHAKFPDAQTWDEDFTREKYPVTCNDLIYAVPDQQRQENWAIIQKAFWAVAEHNSRIRAFEVLKEKIEAGETDLDYLIAS
ncbi:MAG: hypothetical protein DRJ03_30085 [Chloroflexi bacterium]|nr:MAG: hypothetical protein DRJ03_30085 [Chloroflexota bacterium]